MSGRDLAVPVRSHGWRRFHPDRQLHTNCTHAALVEDGQFDDIARAVALHNLSKGSVLVYAASVLSVYTLAGVDPGFLGSAAGLEPRYHGAGLSHLVIDAEPGTGVPKGFPGIG